MKGQEPAIDDAFCDDVVDTVSESSVSSGVLRSISGFSVRAPGCSVSTSVLLNLFHVVFFLAAESLVSIKKTEVDNEFEFDIIYTIRNWHHCDAKYAQNPQDVIWSRLRSIVVCMAPKSSDCIYERHLGYLRSGRR